MTDRTHRVILYFVTMVLLLPLLFTPISIFAWILLIANSLAIPAEVYFARLKRGHSYLDNMTIEELDLEKAAIEAGHRDNELFLRR